MSKNSDLIQVLLATYNGEKYLSEQVESVLRQTYDAVQIVIRDDGSTDSTPALIEEIKQKYGSRIDVVKDNFGNLGSSRCFEVLLRYSSAKYVMFCDQDDVWSDTKIECTYKKMLESDNDITLVFTDLEVVDEELNTLFPSMLSLHRLDGYYLGQSFLRLIAQNPVAGCTIMLSRPAIEKVLSLGEFPRGIVHDHWISAIVGYYGRVLYIDKPTLKYRQHRENQVGVSSIGIGYFIRKLMTIKNTIEHDRFFISALRSQIEVPVFKYLWIKMRLNYRRLIKRKRSSCVA